LATARLAFLFLHHTKIPAKTADTTAQTAIATTAMSGILEEEVPRGEVPGKFSFVNVKELVDICVEGFMIAREEVELGKPNWLVFEKKVVDATTFPVLDTVETSVPLMRLPPVVMGCVVVWEFLGILDWPPGTVWEVVHTVETAVIRVFWSVVLFGRAFGKDVAAVETVNGIVDVGKVPAVASLRPNNT
jgi:hypothetical protein